MTNKIMVALYGLGGLGLLGFAGCSSQVPLDNSSCPCPSSLGYTCCGTGPTATCIHSSAGETCNLGGVGGAGVGGAGVGGAGIGGSGVGGSGIGGWDGGASDGPPVALSRILGIAVGHAHACAVRQDNTVTCIGDNSKGQGTPPPGLFNWVVAGGDVTCGSKIDKSDFTKNGQTVCWGDATYGQTSPPDGVYVGAIGARHACGTDRDNNVFCWGDNTLGQATPPAGHYADLTAGHNHTCATRRGAVNDAGVPDGTIVCWGDNSLGQSTPPPVQTYVSGVHYLSAGGDHTCVTDYGQQVWCWGDKTGGQSTPPVGSFGSLAVAPGHACGSNFSDYSIVCWGDDWGGATPVPPSGAYANLIAGDYRTCAWANDGVKPVVCWGATYELEPWY